MFVFQALDYRDRNTFYTRLIGELEPMLERTWYTNLASASALLMAHLPQLNWVGFYLADANKLRLGPFQGLPACLSIEFGKGVCGTSAAERRSLRVDDVHAFPGHIACDARSRSELVVPLIGRGNGRVLGVLDLDSPELARFSEADRLGLENLVRVLVDATEWPERFGI